MRKYIDAEELKVFMWTMLTGNDLYTPNGIDEFVHELPAANVTEMRHGRWEKGRCSVCGFDWHDIQYEKTKVNRSPYCPNCGAKMRK